ncbi:hypothetical protein GJAV_G00062980 [Gymnothorax javanicus]|nr:hypothetical protein GJAV_G00062980 [Gymnothorax javanicus]
MSMSREVAQIDQFLQETAAREANAKVRLQQFIEELLDRADRAEKQLQIISSCGTTPNGSLGRCSVPGSKGTGRQRNSSLSGTSRGMYQVSDRHSSPSTGPLMTSFQKNCNGEEWAQGFLIVFKYAFTEMSAPLSRIFL